MRRRSSNPFRRLRHRERWAGVLLVPAAVLAAVTSCQPHDGVPPSSWTEVRLAPDDRILILAPHPDDEVLGCGGVIQKAVKLGLPVRVVFLTYGDNNQWSFLMYRLRPVLMPKAIQAMGMVRHDEAIAAASALGLSPEQLTFLGYPDFGTLDIWSEHWGREPAYKSMLTRVRAVPYRNALRPGAPYKGEEVLRDLTTVLREFKPTKVFVSHPGDHMPDHRALYLFTLVALWDLRNDMHPTIYPYLIHFKRWPIPRGFRPMHPLEPPEPFRQQITWQVSPLSPEEISRKEAAVKAHRSQYLYSAQYLLSFVGPDELFGDFPVLTLQAPASSVSLSPDSEAPLHKSPEQLTDLERAAFVGLEWRSVKLEQDDIVLSVTFSRPLAPTVGVSMDLFGYRQDRPFGEMPKLQVRVNALTHTVYDQDRQLPSESVRLTRQLRQVTIRVPRALLGDPERILTSARSYLEQVPLDWVSWRVLVLPSADGTRS